MGPAFKPNKRGLDQLQRDLQRELDKRPVYVRAEADPAGVLPPATTVNNYHGPVVTVSGGSPQIAWDNEIANQTQSRQIASGYESLARLVTDLLASLDTFALEPDDADDVRDSAQVVLSEVVKEQPDSRIIGRSLKVIKGALAPIVAGIGRAAGDEVVEAARHLIAHLGGALPS